MDEKFTARIQELYEELMVSPSAINDAIKNGCCENEMFAVQLFVRRNDVFETHNLIWEYIKKYNLDEAERLAELE